MSEDAGTDRKKKWKAFQANYDFVFAQSDRVCMYCLSDQQIAALLSMTEYLKWPSRWIKTAGAIDPQTILKFTDEMERRLMSGCCDDNLPIQYRYSSAGELERSFNSGNTWTPAPEYDPRNYSPQFPPAAGDDGDDKKCIAATGAADLIKEQIGEQLTDDMTRYTLKQLVEDWVGTMIESSNPFQALVTVITNQIFALVIATLRPALTEAVYETLKCIFYCHMADDATVNNAQWDEIRSEITNQIGGIAGIFLEHLVFLLGAGGTTNLIRAGGAAAGDCSDCDECADVPLVWFQNGALATPQPITPDEDGIYTVTCDVFYSNGYYGNIQFQEIAGTPNWDTCNAITIIDYSSGSVQAKLDCHTGANNALSTCYGLLQWFSASSWTMIFSIGEACG
jgi:hypothetical protein